MLSVVISFLCFLLNYLKHTNIFHYFVLCYCGIQIYVLSLYQQNQIKQHNIMTTTEKVMRDINSKLSLRSTEQLILDAKQARLQKSEESSRMVFALIMDTLMTRITETEFDNLYETLTNN